MKFEIINPSDKAFIEGEFKTCCLAAFIIGRGQYGLEQVDGELSMPIFLWQDPDFWFVDKFGKTLQDLFDSTPKKELSEVLLSVALAHERSSMNDFSGYAHTLGQELAKGAT